MTSNPSLQRPSALRHLRPFRWLGLATIAFGCSGDDADSSLGGKGSDAGGTWVPPVTCGNGVVDTGEICDDGVAPPTCAEATMGNSPAGAVLCTACRLDLAGCSSSAPGAGGSAGLGGASGTGGALGAAGANQGAGGAAPPPPPPGGGPVIPPVTEQCPAFSDSTITFMGLPGIQMVAGPRAGSPTAPMVFYWHGTGSNAGEFAALATAVRNGVVAEGGVLVSFQGTTGGDLLSGTSIFGVSDMNLVDQLVACAVRDHNIDPRRIFTTGCSAGGLFAGALGARRSNYIAAVAPNSGGWLAPQPFQNDNTPALMTMHGAPGADVVIVDFSTTSATADKGFKDRGAFVINCNTGGGHCGAGALSPSVWEFFKAHPYGTQPSPWTGGLPPGFASSCQIY